jgi:uncharacterized membrane protein
MLVGVGVIVLYIAQHISGGGYLHPRYLFPVLGSIAVLLVIGLDRIWPRMLPVVVLASMAVWTLSQIPIGVDPSLTSRPRDEGRLAPAALRVLPGSDAWRQFTALWIVVGLMVTVVAIGVVVFGQRASGSETDRTTDSDVDAR